MIENYYRPDSLDDALTLLTDSKKSLVPLGGGTRISRHQEDITGVVDLQDVDLDHIVAQKQNLKVGAMVRLADLADHIDVHPELQRAVRIDASENIRNAATLGGWLVSSDGRSVVSTTMLTLDAVLTWEPGHKEIRMGDWLPLREIEQPGAVIAEIAWDLRPHLALEVVARSPKDRAILIVAAAQWGSGRTRMVLGGTGKRPIVAMDGPDDGGADIACRDAYAEAEDEWASSTYRREVAAKLALRCLDRIKAIKESEV